MERGDIETVDSASGLTRRLEEFIATAVRIWGNGSLNWETVLAATKAELGIDDQDRTINDLVGRLTSRNAPGDSVPLDEYDLVGKGALAVRTTVERRFGRQADNRQSPDPKGTVHKNGDTAERLREDRDRREREQREHREQRERHIVAPPAALGQTIHAAIASIHMVRRQPLSGRVANVPFDSPVPGFQISGFESVSPPEQIPFEYRVGEETFTGTATADQDSQLPISTTLTFRTKMHVISQTVDRARADFTLSFDRQAYYVIDQAHGEINRAELARPRRFANLTLGLTGATKRLPKDLVTLDLSVAIEQNRVGSIIYYLNWTWSGQLYQRVGEAKEIRRHGSIKLNPNGQLFAEDELTHKYFNLPRS